MRTSELNARGWTYALLKKHLEDVKEFRTEHRGLFGICVFYVYDRDTVLQREQQPEIAKAMAKVLAQRAKRRADAETRHSPQNFRLHDGTGATI
jgi:hypothetical protein